MFNNSPTSHYPQGICPPLCGGRGKGGCISVSMGVWGEGVCLYQCQYVCVWGGRVCVCISVSMGVWGGGVCLYQCQYGCVGRGDVSVSVSVWGSVDSCMSV